MIHTGQITNPLGSTRHTVNARVLAVSLVFLAVAAPATYFWHQRSVTQMSQSFLDRARQLKKTGDEHMQAGRRAAGEESLRQSVDALWQFRRIRPDHGPSAVLLAKTFESAPQGRENRNRAAQLYLESLAWAEENEKNALRLRAAEIFLEDGDFLQTEKVVGELISQNDSLENLHAELRPAVARVHALALFGQVNEQSLRGDKKSEVGPALIRAINENPHDVFVPVSLAAIYRNPDWHDHLSEEQREQLTQGQVSVAEMAEFRADQIVDDMVARNVSLLQEREAAANLQTEASTESTEALARQQRNLAHAYLRRYMYRDQYGIEGAGQDIRRARQQDPDNPVIALHQGLYLLEQHRQNRIVRSDGNNNELTQDDRERLDQAKVCFEACVANNPDYLLPYLYLGDVQMELGAEQDAIATWLKVIEQSKVTNNDPSMVVSGYSRLVGGLIDTERIEEAESQLNQMGNLVSRQSVLTEDPKMLAEAIQTQQLLTGMLQFRNGDFSVAIDTLEEALDNSQETSATQVPSIIRLLGEIHLALEQPSQAANIYEMAVRANRFNREYRLRLSQARAQAGQFEMAAIAFEPLVRREDATARDWLEYAELLLRVEIGKPSQLRQWDAFENALRKSRGMADQTVMEKPWRIDLLEIQSWLTRGDFAGAESDGDPALRIQLQNLVNQFELAKVEDPDLIRQLVLVFEQMGDLDRAQRWLEKFDSVVGPKADRYLLPAELLARRGEYAAAADKLAQGLQQLEVDQHLQLQLAEVNLQLASGEVEKALTVMETLVYQRPDRPELVLRMAELYTQLPDRITSEPSEWEDGLLRIEGNNGPFTNFLRASRAIIAFDDAADAALRDSLLADATRFCREVVQKRPDWASGNALAGSVYFLRGEWIIQKNNFDPQMEPDKVVQQASEMHDLARRFYQRAVDLGERRSWVLLRLAELDSSMRGQLLSLLDPKRILGNRSLSNMQMSLQVANNDLETAQVIAARATEVRPTDPYAWLDRATAEIILQSTDQAEQSLRRARDLILSSNDPLRPLQRLFDVYLLGQQFSASATDKQRWIGQATNLIPDIVRLTPEPDQPLEQAKLLMAVNSDRASNAFLAAEKHNPDNLEILQMALQYFSSQDISNSFALDQAIRISRKILSVQSDLVDIRRLMARLLAVRGSVDDWNEVDQLLDAGDLQGHPLTGETQRILAGLLLNKRDLPNSERLKNLERANNILKVNRAPADLTLRGQVLVEWAELLETSAADRAAKLDQAAHCFVNAAETLDVNEFQLYTIADFFIEQTQWETDEPRWSTAQERLEIANAYLLKLKSLLGDSPTRSGPAIDLQVRLLQRQAALAGQDVDRQAIVRMIEGHGRQIESLTAIPKDLRARHYQQVATLLQTANAAPETILGWQQKAIQEDPSQRLGLAARLAESGELDRALDECVLGYEQTGLTDYLVEMANFLLIGDTQPVHLEKVNGVFNTAVQRHANDAMVLAAVAGVRLACEDRVQDAIDLYEQALQVDRDNWLLLNNLAAAYAELPDRLTDAQQTIDRAIQIHGPRAALVDARAVISMRQGKLKEAELDLLEILNKRSDARYWFHLAEVKWKQYELSREPDQLKTSRSAMTQAVELGLDQQPLTAGERKRLSKLRDNLNIDPASSLDRSAQ